MQENKDFALTWRVKEYGNNMGATFKYYEDVDSWKTIMFLYTSALKEVGTKLEILMMSFSMSISIIRSNISRQELKRRKAL